MKIGIIGAGPRGLSMLERILRNKQTNQSLQIYLFDVIGPGGRVWRIDQSTDLLMNSVSQQVTLFTDDTLSTGGVVSPGPNLYQWAKKEGIPFVKQQSLKQQNFFLVEMAQLGKNEHTTRCLYGLYQQWFFMELQKEYPDTITFVRSLVNSVSQTEAGFDLKADDTTFFMDQIVLASGHWENELMNEELAFADYAQQHGLFYQPPSNPADVSVDDIPTNEPIFLRGLGLAFFDYIGLLTVGRGGYFEEQEDHFIYHPSGNEPVIYAGSRRGVPYYPRGKNQKQGGAMARLKLLTTENLKKWQIKGQLTGERFFDLFKKEVELFYYQKTIEEQQLAINPFEFEQVFLLKPSEECLADYPQLEPYIWSWERLEQPLSTFPDDFEKGVRSFLAWQINEAEKGNDTGAFSSTLDAIKDWREPIREAIAWDVFSVEEYREQLWSWFTPLNAFLTIGPPLKRSKELAALIDAGIFHIAAPPFEIKRARGNFWIETAEKAFKSRYLLEAHLPINSVSYSKNPVIQSMSKNGLIRAYQKTEDTEHYFSGAIDVNKANQVIGADGKVIPHFYCYGIPVEGVDWLTAAVARPYTDAWNLRQADLIARHLLNNKRKVNKKDS
ncbi:FAD/NAD(P)-binding protein [Candidatus Enterococcus courvalinii]|uniref:FAD/NAD(P)-binding protein n=1 Tax=Candidatus Enterococcus courvalinii TaxID=2815329 RepID=A0ABS3I1Q3_9ENTE|nr:FAD/NAD(P)-binding protein [Enterococcus sp. MSG2901]MBO0482097.1 FAD/NAD(P)-binding protein [Enterococcus sp. MSG2901]